MKDAASFRSYLDSLNLQQQKQIQQITLKIKNRLRRCAQDIVEIGNDLCQIKKHLKHGEFRQWLKVEFDWSVSTANKFMQVSQRFTTKDLVDVEIAPSALYLLSASSLPDTVRQNALEQAKQGKPISFSFAQQLINTHKTQTSEVSIEEEVSRQAHQEHNDVVSSALPDQCSSNINVYPFANFSICLQREWQRMAREQKDLSVIIAQIDDTSLLLSAEILEIMTNKMASLLHRPADFIVYDRNNRWFIILPNTSAEGAHWVRRRFLEWFSVWQNQNNSFHNLEMPKLSLGNATVVPQPNSDAKSLIEQAQRALKQEHYTKID